MKTKFIRRFAIGASALLAASLPAYTCGNIALTAKDNSFLVARTMEFGVDLKSNIRSSPKGRTFDSTTSNNKPGQHWTSRYGYLYIDGFGVDAAFDGLNEAGLSFGYLYLPGETTYQDIPDGKDAQAIPYYAFGDWVLGNFKTVDDVRQGLKDVYVSAQKLPQLGDAVLPAHAVIYDASGKGIVVEFYDNKINVSDSMGILTNSPKYDWHITNLRNYLNLSAQTPDSQTLGGITYGATGQGSGAVGLPGDASPPSRFVKLAFMAANVYKAENIRELLNQAEHIVNNVDLPAGYVRSTQNGKTESDTTQWAVFKDIGNKMLYYRTYNDMSLRVIDLSKVNFSENAARLKMPMADTRQPLNVTGRFLSATQAP